MWCSGESATDCLRLSCFEDAPVSAVSRCLTLATQSRSRFTNTEGAPVFHGHHRQQQVIRLNGGGDDRHRTVGQDVAVLRQLVAQHEVAALAVGLPLDLKGVEGSAVAGVRAYAHQICRNDVRPLKTPRNALCCVPLLC